MSKKIFTIITVSLLILIVALGIFSVVVILGAKDKTQKPQTNNPAAPKTSEQVVKKVIAKNKKQADKKKTVGEDDLRRLASSFVERFGSFSNQSNFRNIVDLRIFMSKEMLAWANDYINKKRLTTPSDIYYGISTKAVFSEIKSYNETDGRAIVLVKTRRREAVGSTDNTAKIFDQDILVEFIKENEQWKVRSARWQD